MKKISISLVCVWAHVADEMNGIPSVTTVEFYGGNLHTTAHQDQPTFFENKFLLLPKEVYKRHLSLQLCAVNNHALLRHVLIGTCSGRVRECT